MKDHHNAYLDRTARSLSKRLGKNVSKAAVLEALLDLAIRDEGIYDPEQSGRPLDPTRKAFVRESRFSLSANLDVASLMSVLASSEGASCSRRTDSQESLLGVSHRPGSLPDLVEAERDLRHLGSSASE